MKFDTHLSRVSDRTSSGLVGDDRNLSLVVVSGGKSLEFVLEGVAAAWATDKRGRLARDKTRRRATTKQPSRGGRRRGGPAARRPGTHLQRRTDFRPPTVELFRSTLPDCGTLCPRRTSRRRRQYLLLVNV